MIDFTPLVFKDKNKEVVQRQAYDKWLSANCKGTLEIATGVGKTMIGLMALQQNRQTKAIIVVPKVDLQKQWIDAISEFGLFPGSDIGRVGDGYHELDKKIVIAVVNSIRDKYLKADLLIMDEIHRYGSYDNFKFLSNGIFDKILGLTATIEREDGMHDRLFKYAPKIFEYEHTEAIDANILSKYELINMKVSLTLEEQDAYNRINSFIRTNFHLFKNDFLEVKSSIRYGGVRSMIASDLMKAFGRRRAILMHATNKVLAACDIISESNDKTIIFCEYIKTADRIIRALGFRNIKAAKYHSKMSPTNKREMLDDFKSNKYQVMVAVKSLDEGTNIPDCGAAIIVGGTKVERQTIQRLGRILRKHESKSRAKVFNLYVPGTKDVDWAMSRNAVLEKGAEEVKWTEYKTKT